jgi:hypothetical protein
LIHFDENGFLISGKLIAGAVARSGTESSNPALSSGESVANSNLSAERANVLAARDQDDNVARP